MRRGNEPDFLSDDKGNFIGVCLSADFTSEHEWGISSLRTQYGIPWDKLGVFGMARRKITKLSPDYHSFLGRTQPTIVNAHIWDEEEKFLDSSYLKSELSIYKTKEIAGAWSEKDFGVKTTAAHLKEMEQLDQAFRSLDITIFLGGAKLPVFDNPGLCLVIASKIPAEYVAMWEKSDRDHVNLMKADKENDGLKKRLEAAGKRWYALSPRWTPAECKTASKVIYWLNPQEQEENNAGWCTVEDLELWAKNEGPIPKRKKTWRLVHC